MPNEPLVLLGNADKWLAESLESVLTQGGYRVLATTKRQQVVELARRYAPDGINRRSAALAAFTARQGLPLACVVFQPDNGDLTAGAADRLAQALRRAGRISDAVGRTGPAEFTVFAPATDETGAEGLVQRITDAVARSESVKLRAGTSTAPGAPRRPSRASSPAPASPTELLARARNALR